MYRNAVIVKVELTKKGCTKGGAPIGRVLASDSVGTGNKHRLHLRLDTYKYCVTE